MINRCKTGEIVLHKGKEVYVNCVICQGVEDTTDTKGRHKKGFKAEISACRIMLDNGQIIHRSPFHVGANWEHLPDK